LILTWKKRVGPLDGYFEEKLDLEVTEIRGEWWISFPKDEKHVHRIEWVKNFSEVLTLIKKEFGSALADSLENIWQISSPSKPATKRANLIFRLASFQSNDELL